MGKLPRLPKKQPPEVRVTASVECDGYTQLAITYGAEENDFVPAYLMLSKGRLSGQRLPAIMALHQTIDLGRREVAGEGGNPNLAYGKELAQRGYVVL